MKILKSSKNKFGDILSDSLNGFHRHRRKVICRMGKVILGLCTVSLLLSNLFTLHIHNHKPDKGAEYEERGVGRLSNQLKLQQLADVNLNIRVISSKEVVSVSVDNTMIYEDKSEVSGRGIHVLVLHQGTGALMAQRVFDTYSPREDEAMALFVNMVSDDRIFVFAIKDEGTFQLKPAGRQLLMSFGSKEMERVGWRDMWAMIAIKGTGMVSEGYSKSADFTSWGNPVELCGEVALSRSTEPPCWTSERRIDFCDRIEGYGSVCNCDNPAPILFNPPPPINNQIQNIPVAIIASNRPHYLYRMLQSLLSARGADPEMIVVFIDGFFEETLAVARLFGLRGVQHAPVGHGTARISQHYKISLSAIFSMFPRASHAIVLEEDLDVSPDFFSYFSQTIGLLRSDPSLYCVSAWNDLGYQYTSADPSLLYRVETMPGLGWMLSRELFEQELEPQWPSPEKTWDWDMWMRLNEVRRGRECIIPDVSRTFHFGSSGVNMNSYFHDVYFSKHSFNTAPEVDLVGVESLIKDEYEALLEYELGRGEVVLYSPCQGVFQDSTDTPHIFFIEMKHAKDFSSWLALAKCLHIWDLDARGYHRGLWRLHINNAPFFIIGAPYSPYSIYKPAEVTPMRFKTKKTTARSQKKSNNQVNSDVINP